MDAPAWSAQLLAEFIAAVSAAETEAGAARAAVEHAAEALDADVAAIVGGGHAHLPPRPLRVGQDPLYPRRR
jgi:hypothetical protein